MTIKTIQYSLEKGHRVASIVLDASPLDTAITITAYILHGKPHCAFTFYIGPFIKRLAI